ncbi:WxcM-like protein [Breznakibacter xylanolyticus]|uniref:WxcM-like protein n=1 Tax=Breznakibacter xylanolyticus TaxID=990 RepID=A0A2W7PXJ9_9BACT|nr:FdtA/QdtA family cupin domain-containing protein [Breznakibacter xylanolyticus]MBN2744054.1 WxcM-like domain-containing protein [Marinilabiliaceae bacterium]PZX14269.1 WxcM-like protein [Breznakibacter xylanolyticus]
MERVIELPKILDERGNLTFVEQVRHIPFEIKRVYWIYDVPGGQIRGGHAFREQQEVIIALSGSFDVQLNDGKVVKPYHLNRSYYGLYVPGGIWRHMENFSTNSVALVISSTKYDESDYIRDFSAYQTYLNEHKSL